MMFGLALSFLLLDATQFQSPHPYMGEPVKVVYEKQVLGSWDNYGAPPDEKIVRKNLSKFRGADRIILDVESWTILKNNQLDPKASEHAAYYKELIDLAHNILPTTNIGYFGIPAKPWWPLRKPEYMPAYNAALKLLAAAIEASDTLYPSFYVYYDDSDGVWYSSSVHLFLAKQYGKPVCPFLWRRGPGSIFGNRLLPDYLIDQQYNLAKSFAGCAVWWSMYGERLY